MSAPGGSRAISYVGEKSPTSRPPTGVEAPFSRSRFPILLGGQTISALGDAFANVAMPLLVLRTTGSVTQMGVVAGVSTGAQLLGGLVAGPAVDRLDRRRILILCDWAQMLLGASIPLAWWLFTPGGRDRFGMALIYAVVFASSILVSLSTVGLRAAMPQIVDRSELIAANGRLTVATEIAYGCGPAIAGLTIAALGEPTAIGLNAVTFGLSAVAWYFVRMRRFADLPRDTIPATTGLGGRLAGLAFLRRDGVQLNLALFEVANGLLVAGVTVLFIYYVRTDFRAGSTMVGVLLSLASVGAVLAAVVAPRLRRHLGYGRGWLAAIAVEGAALVAVGLTSSLWAVAALAVVFAFGQVAAIILAMSYRQERTPDRLLGRVSAAVLTMSLAARAVGGVASTWAASRVATRDVFVAIGVLVCALVVVGAGTPLRRTPSQRKEAAR